MNERYDTEDIEFKQVLMCEMPNTDGSKVFKCRQCGMVITSSYHLFCSSACERLFVNPACDKIENDKSVMTKVESNELFIEELAKLLSVDSDEPTSVLLEMVKDLVHQNKQWSSAFTVWRNHSVKTLDEQNRVWEKCTEILKGRK